MSEAVRQKPNAGILARVLHVEGRMDGLETRLQENRDAARKENEATHGLLEEVLMRLGAPQSGADHKATGLYWAVDAVSERVKPFERAWERCKGAVIVAVPLLGALWWLGGEKLAKLFHG